MSIEEAVRIIWNPATLPETRERLRSAVYARFDELYEEATGKRARVNQGVWDALERWQVTRRKGFGGGEKTKIGICWNRRYRDGLADG